jgi:acetate kinase
MSDALLVLNAGSSSLKFSVFLDEDPPQPLLRGQLEGLPAQPRFVARRGTAVVGEKEWPAGTKLGHQGAIEFLFAWGRGDALGGHRIVATGHRVVHGGMKFTAPVLIDTETLAALESLVSLAPLHQPHNLAAIKAVAQIAPTLPQVGCFDALCRHQRTEHRYGDVRRLGAA